MTESKAIGFIQGKLNCMKKCDTFDCRNSDECDECNYCYTQGTFGEQKEALQMAIKVLEKQIPKKPIKSENQVVRYVNTYYCPTCESGITGTNIAKWCYHCGQKIDWSDERMRIEIEIPKEFEEHFNQDKFKDSFERIMADIKHSLENRDYLCAGRYEYETIEMLEKAFENSRQAYDVDKVVEELEKASYRIDDSATLSTRDVIDIEDAIEIVKHGGVRKGCEINEN